MTNEILKETNRADYKLSQDKGTVRMEDKSYTSGIYDLPIREYHKLKAISRSAISELKKSPLHYWEKFINPEPKEEKSHPALNLGNAVHTLVLEPEKFLDEFAVMEKVDLRTTKGKEYQKLFDENSQGKIILKEEDYLLAKNISQEILNHPSVSVILKDSFSVEKSIFWIDEDTELVCKARPDIWSHSLGVIFDIKTTNDASPENFMYSIRKYNYHIQAAMQIDAIFKNTGEMVKGFSILAAPTEAPHKPYIYMLDDDTIKQGRYEYQSALKIIKKCMDNNRWDLDREEVIPIGMPHFSLNTNPFFKLMEIYECQI